jgi:23S rRNA (uracil-5-)-methyltransferase rumA
VNDVNFKTGVAEKIIPLWKEEGIQSNVIVVVPPNKECNLVHYEKKKLKTIVLYREK